MSEGSGRAAMIGQTSATNGSQSAAPGGADGEAAPARPHPRHKTSAPHASRLTPYALFLAFLGFYLLTASGHLYAVDEETLYVQTESIVERGTIAVPRGAWGMV